MKKIAYQGIEGSFSYLAATKFFSKNNKFIGTNNFKEIFDLINENKVDFGVIPIENSLAGSVYENYDLLNKYPVKVVGEIYLKIKLYLLGIKTKIPIDLRLKLLRKVYSHPKALEESKLFLEKYPYIEKVNFSDTARAAKFVSETNDLTISAIASKECAKIYNLQILKSNIEDFDKNYTRFLIIVNKNKYKPNPKANKCTLIFTLKHIPGSLYNALEVFARNKINLTKIESRPIPQRPFEYRFFLDFVFNKRKISEVESIIKEFSNKVLELKNLGFYEAGKIK